MIGHIYKITETLTGPETINNYIYIGSTLNKEKRYATHKTNFKQSKNRKLYKLIHNMRFEILETVEIENKFTWPSEKYLLRRNIQNLIDPALSYFQKLFFALKSEQFFCSTDFYSIRVFEIFH